MKKIINILLAVCLMVSMLGVSALAEEATPVYSGPKTHSYPTIIDFNDEHGSRGDNGIRYYNQMREPKHFYYFEGYISAHLTSEEDEPNEVEMQVLSTATASGGVAANSGIKFQDFEYVETETGKQPEKLVVSVDVKYTDIDDAPKNNVEFGAQHRHISFGSKTIDTETVGAVRTNTNDPTTAIAYFGHGLSNNGKFIANNGDEYFFNWSYNVDVENDVVTGAVYNNGVALEETALNNQAYKTKLNNGEWLTYTYVMDLTRDDNGKGNVIVYVDDEKTDTLVSREADVDKINFMTFSANLGRIFRFDNVRIYTVDNDKIAKTSAIVKKGEDEVSTEAAPVTTDEVIVNFNHEITAAADKYLVVKKGNQVLEAGEDYTIEHIYGTTDAKTAKSLKVKFNEELSYQTEYKVCGSADYFGIDGYALGAETEFASFTTELAPQINLSNFVVTKGFSGNIAISDLSEVLGSTAGVKVTVANEEGAAAVGTVFFGVYKNDILVSLAYVNKTFAVDETEDITVNLKVPVVLEGDTLEIKAFACEGLGNLDPYGTTHSISIAD